jgi:hypothetical protein
MYEGPTRCFVEVDANGVGMFMITTFPEAEMQQKGIVLPKSQMPSPGPVAMVWNPETAAWVSHLGEIKTKMVGIKNTLQALQENPIQAASAVKADVEWLIHFVGNCEKLAAVFESKLKEEVPKIVAARKRMMAEAEAQMKEKEGGNQGQ